jgi:uncharacterized cupredoxin-like copper-binding protein
VSDSPSHEVTQRNGLAYAAIGVAVLAVLVALFALGVAMAAKNGTSAPAADGGGGGGGETTAAEVAQTVGMTEFAFDPSSFTVPEGATIEAVNDGQVAHNFTIRNENLTTGDVDPGSSATLSLAGLAPGTYEFYCTIPGHEQAGMVGEVTIG